MENSMKFPQEISNRATIWYSKATSGYFSEGSKNTNSKNVCTPVFIAALFTIAKTWKQPLSVEECIDKTVI